VCHTGGMGSYLSGRLITLLGDIVTLEVDGIVNAANSSLLGGGGVDGAIHRAAGPSLLEECRALRASRYPDGLPTGQAVATGAGNLKAKRVIHTVGPVWRGGRSGEEALLASAYRSCLEIAEVEGLRSLAFPAISTGVYGFPRELAAPIVWSAMRTWLGAHALPETVTLVFFKPEDLRTFAENA